MLEVRYVLSLAHHDVSIYGGGEDIPDGELFIKRNALCLTRKIDAGETTADGTTSKPFFLFADNTSDKEDFYFAMLKNQERKPDAVNNPPIPLQFDVKDMIALVQRLHSSEEHLQTRWINAMLGRIFLSLYKTSDVENFIRAKITKKISRVKTPSLISGIILRHIDMGEGAPFVTNPRLKDLTVDGDCVVEADVRYTGNFRLEIAATARIDLGTRFKAREVNLLLAVVLKKIEGHCFLRVKPPPSNRVWMTFSQPPKIEMSIEPIVSSRQITYTLILRQIENRIKEVIAESIVMPFWDDIAFYSTEGKKWRGGIWTDDTATRTTPDLGTAAAEEGEVDLVEHLESESSSNAVPPVEKSKSLPLSDSNQSTTYSRKAARSLFNLTNSKATASSTSVDTNRTSTTEGPRAIRHGSFASAASPVVGMDVTNADAVKAATPPEHSHAASAMAAITARSSSSSPHDTPQGSPSRPSSFTKPGSQSSASSGDHDGTEETNSNSVFTTDETASFSSHIYPSSLNSISAASYKSDTVPSFDNRPRSKESTTSSGKHTMSEHSLESSSWKTSINQPHHQDSTSTSSNKSSNGVENSPTAPKRNTLTAVANAAASARRWGLNALQRSGDHSREGSTDRQDMKPDLTQPMGRGRPLPPLGVPLPPPDRKTPTAPIPVPKRKPLAPPVLPKRPNKEESQKGPSISTNQAPSESIEGAQKSPRLPERPSSQHATSQNEPHHRRPVDDGLFVVAAPPDSEPTTPLSEFRPAYLQPFVTDDDEEGETSKSD
jgi:hypothetical protein